MVIKKYCKMNEARASEERSRVFPSLPQTSKSYSCIIKWQRSFALAVALNFLSLFLSFSSRFGQQKAFFSINELTWSFNWCKASIKSDKTAIMDNYFKERKGKKNLFVSRLYKSIKANRWREGQQRRSKKKKKMNACCSKVLIYWWSGRVVKATLSVPTFCFYKQLL